MDNKSIKSILQNSQNKKWANNIISLLEDTYKPTRKYIINKIKPNKELIKAQKTRSLEDLVAEYCTRENPDLFQIYEIYKKLPEDLQPEYNQRLYELLKNINIESWKNQANKLPEYGNNIRALLTDIKDVYEAYLETLKNKKTVDTPLEKYAKSLKIKNKSSSYILNTVFLLAYEINPVILDGISLYDSHNDCLVKFRNVDKKNNKFFINNKIDTTLDNVDEIKTDYTLYPNDDKIIVAPYSKKLIPHDDYTYNVTFVTDKGEPYDLSISEFKEYIYNLPINQEAIKLAAKGHPLTDKELVLKVLKSNELQANTDTYQKHLDTIDSLSTDFELLEKLKNAKENHHDKIIHEIIKKKEDGFTNSDIKYILDEWEPYLTWIDENRIFQVIKDEFKKLNKTIDNDEFEKQLHKWYRAGLNGEALFKPVQKWYKSQLAQTESVITEKYASTKEKIPSITDPGEVAEYAENLGIDTMFLQIPLTRKGSFDQAKGIVVQPDRNYVIRGFENKNEINKIIELQNKLKDYDQAEKALTKYMDPKNKKKFNFDTFNLLKNEYDQLKSEYGDSATKELEKLKRLTKVYVKDCDENEVPKGRPYTVNLIDIYNDYQKPINQDKIKNMSDVSNTVGYDTHAPFRNRNEHKFFFQPLTNEMIGYLVKQAKAMYADEVPRGFTIPNGLTPETIDQYMGTKALIDAIKAAKEPVFHNGFRYKKDSRGQIVGIDAKVGFNPNSTMNSIPKKSITRMV